MSQPKAISSTISNKICELQEGATRFLMADRIDMVKLIKDARNLIRTDAGNAHIALGMIYQLTGDIENAVKHLKNAKKLGASNAMTALTVAYSNLGFFSKAQEVFKDSQNPKTGEGFFLMYATVGLASGAFATLNNFINQSIDMNLDMSSISVDKSMVERSAKVLNDADISDAQVAAIMDIAGEVMRENRLFFHGKAPEISIGDSHGTNPCVYIGYLLPVTPAEAADLYMEFTARLFSRMDSVPEAIHISLKAA